MRALNIRLLHIDDLALRVVFLVILEDAAADLRALGIEVDGQVDAGLLADFAYRLDAGQMLVMRTVAEVQTDDIHSGFGKLRQNLLGLGRRADCADNLCFLAEDTLFFHNALLLFRSPLIPGGQTAGTDSYGTDAVFPALLQSALP